MILNTTKDGACLAITSHYHKEGLSNLIGGGRSKILATAVIEIADDKSDTTAGENGVRKEDTQLV